MRLKLKFLFIFSLLATLSFGQKVDLDPWRFEYKYQDLPYKPLGSDFTTYNVKVIMPGNIRNSISDEQVKDMVVLHGWKQVNEQGHLTVTVSMEDLIIEELRVLERFNDSKDKNGVVTRTYYYKPYAAYSFQANAEVKNYKGELLTKMLLCGRVSRFVWEGTETTSSKEAYDYINNNRQVLRDQFVRIRVETAMRDRLTPHISTDYGFTPRRGMDLVYLLDNKSNPEYEGHQKVVKFVKESIGKKMTYTVPIDSLKAEFAPLKEYLEGTIKKFSKDDKRDKKMRYAAYYALGKISYWLDDPEATIKYGEGLIANDYDVKDGKELVEMGKALKELFAKNKIYSRHFSIDASGFQPPKQ